MKIGDLVKCGDEFAIIVDAHWTTDYSQTQWVTTLWTDGTIEEFEPRLYEEVVEVISESR